MTFHPTDVSGCYVLEPEHHHDARGYFARMWCRRELAARGLRTDLTQCSTSFNRVKGTLRGLHYQTAPHEEAKLVRCTRGRLFDVALDLRPASPSYLRYASAELSADNGLALYVPEGCAHGFLTLDDATEVLYLIAGFYAPEVARGVRWDDPAFGIAWPGAVRVLHDRDRTYPDFLPASPPLPQP